MTDDQDGNAGATTEVAPAEAVTITEPGFYPELAEDDYHRDPVPGGSLSSTGARELLPPGCPAKFHHNRAAGQSAKPRKVFEIGSAAHAMVLGNGPELVLVDRPRWDTNQVKAEVAAIREAGMVPLKAPEYEAVHEMADAIRANKDAAQLLAPGTGEAEVSGFWQDPETGIWCRLRADYLIRIEGRRPVIVDYKSAATVDPETLAKDAAKFGYHVQAAWYRDGVQHLVGGDPVFVFIAQEKTAPYLVTPFYLDRESLREGHQRAAAARRIYAECTETGVWPGYVDDITALALPPWAITEEYA